MQKFSSPESILVILEMLNPCKHLINEIGSYLVPQGDSQDGKEEEKDRPSNLGHEDDDT